MNLKTIEVWNFQSLKHIVLNLSQGFNCIIGNTCSGKSAILKAIDLVVNNRPLGYEDYMSHWCKDGDEVKVALTTSEDVTVTRLRSKSKNQYLLSTLSKPLEGFGTGVPDEVKEALNIHDINMQLQGFPYFLLNQSPPEVARYLNKLVNLEVIDITHSNANKKVLSIKKDLNRETDELEALYKDLEEYQGLDEIDARLTYFEGLERKIEEENAQYEILCDAEEEMLNCYEKLSPLKKILEHEERLNSLISLKDKFVSFNEDYNSLVYAFSDMENLLRTIESNKVILKYEDKLDRLINLVEEKNELEKKHKSLSSAFDEMIIQLFTIKENEKKLKYEEKLNGLMDLNNEIEIFNENIIEYEKLLSSMIEDEKLVAIKEKKLKELEDEFHSKFPDTCPLCGKER